jgi:hypothetical protein
VDQTCLVWSEVELKWTSWPTCFHLCLCVCIMQIVSCSLNWKLRTRSVFAGSWRKVSARAASIGGKVHWQQQSCEIVSHAAFMACKKFERARLITFNNLSRILFSVRYKECLNIAINWLAEGLPQMIVATIRSCISSCFCWPGVLCVYFVMLAVFLFSLQILKLRNYVTVA